VKSWSARRLESPGVRRERLHDITACPPRIGRDRPTGGTLSDELKRAVSEAAEIGEMQTRVRVDHSPTSSILGNRVRLGDHLRAPQDVDTRASEFESSAFGDCPVFGRFHRVRCPCGECSVREFRFRFDFEFLSSRNPP